MKTIDKRIELLKKYQEEMDHRTKIENEAIMLMEKGQFEEATELLKTLDDNIIKGLQRKLDELSAPELEAKEQAAVENIIEVEESNEENINRRLQKYQKNLTILKEKSKQQKINISEIAHKKIKRTLTFEELGEQFTIEISTKNVSTAHEKDLKFFFDGLYKNALEEFNIKIE